MSIEAMKQALEKATKVMEDACIRVDELKAENESLRQAIAEAEKHEVSQEPVAWIDDEGEFQWIKKIDNPEHTAFYTHPQPKREPMTNEQIAEFFGVKAVDESFVDFVRAIEAAHGIKEKNT